MVIKKQTIPSNSTRRMRVLRVGVELVESKTPLCPISLNSAVDILAKNKYVKKVNVAV